MSILIGLKTKITTTSFEATRDWYRDLFGLTAREEWDDPDDRGCILGLGSQGREAFLEIYFGEQPADFAGLSLQFRVDDIGRFHIPSEPRFAFRGPEGRPWGSRYLFLTDPNGISVVIFSGTSL